MSSRFLFCLHTTETFTCKKKEKKIHIGTKAMLQFIHIFRLTHKNIVQYHSYFRGHLQNQLSARGHLRLHLRLCVCGLEFPVTETIRPTSLFCFGVFFARVTWQPYDPIGGQLIMLCVSIKLLNNSTLKIACDTLKKKCSEKEEWGSTNRCKDTHRQLLSRGFCLMTVQFFFLLSFIPIQTLL